MSARKTISFTIDEEQLRQVDELSELLDRDRSSTLRRLIDVGLPVVRASGHVQVMVKSDRVHTPS